MRVLKIPIVGKLKSFDWSLLFIFFFVIVLFLVDGRPYYRSCQCWTTVDDDIVSVARLGNYAGRLTTVIFIIVTVQINVSPADAPRFAPVKCSRVFKMFVVVVHCNLNSLADFFVEIESSGTLFIVAVVSASAHAISRIPISGLIVGFAFATVVDI